MNATSRPGAGGAGQAVPDLKQLRVYNSSFLSLQTTQTLTMRKNISNGKRGERAEKQKVTRR